MRLVVTTCNAVQLTTQCNAVQCSAACGGTAHRARQATHAAQHKTAVQGAPCNFWLQRCCGLPFCAHPRMNMLLTRCNTVQHVATQCNTLQHSAARCNTVRPCGRLGLACSAWSSRCTRLRGKCVRRSSSSRAGRAGECAVSTGSTHSATVRSRARFRTVSWSYSRVVRQLSFGRN
jgi:hypothetical protein